MVTYIQDDLPTFRDASHLKTTIIPGNNNNDITKILLTSTVMATRYYIVISSFSGCILHNHTLVG